MLEEGLFIAGAGDRGRLSSDGIAVKSLTSFYVDRNQRLPCSGDLPFSRADHTGDGITDARLFRWFGMALSPDLLFLNPDESRGEARLAAPGQDLHRALTFAYTTGGVQGAFDRPNDGGAAADPA